MSALNNIVTSIEDKPSSPYILPFDRAHPASIAPPAIGQLEVDEKSLLPRTTCTPLYSQGCFRFRMYIRQVYIKLADIHTIRGDCYAMFILKTLNESLLSGFIHNSVEESEIWSSDEIPAHFSIGPIWEGARCGRDSVIKVDMTAGYYLDELNGDITSIAAEEALVSQTEWKRRQYA